MQMSMDLCAVPQYTLRWLGTTFIQCGTNAYKDMFIYVLGPGWGDKFYGQKKWHYVPVISEVVIQVTSKSSFIDVKKNEKLQLNYWNYTLNWAIYRCKNDEYTPKNGYFL